MTIKQKKILDSFRSLSLSLVILLVGIHFKEFLAPLLSLDLTKLYHSQLLTYEWIIPLVSVLALLDTRRIFTLVAGLPSWRGLAFTVFFLVALLLSVHFEKPPLQFLSITGLTFAVSYAFWGRGVATLLKFPMSLLAFTIPVTFYLSLVESLSPHLAAAVTFVGSALELSGFEMFKGWFGLTGFTLGTSSPYSGIRLLFAVTAITFSLAHFTVTTRPQRWALYLCAFPLAFVIDLLRTFFICLIAYRLDRTWAADFYGYSSDFLAFFVAVLFIFQIANLVVRISARIKKPSAKEWLRSLEQGETAASEPEQSLTHSIVIVFLVTLCAVITFSLID
jgi:exosortase/archaeosortase family protein